MYDLNIPYKEYGLLNKRIIWFWDDKNSKAENFLVNNLFVCDENYMELWNMRCVQSFDDVCTGLFLFEKYFYFYTFAGCGISIEISTLNVLNKSLVR